MRLVVTGGGTGGHVYPALEIARAAKAAGHQVLYLGSLRGQEGKLCHESGFEFAGFASEPITSWRKPRGWRAALRIYQASRKARAKLEAWRADVVFSTGGYSSAPIVQAAKVAGIPYVIHEQNTVPGRTNRLLGRHAAAIATTFRTGHEHFGKVKVVRTGMPIRQELRQSAQGNLFGHQSPDTKPLILVMGGSQGATRLNEAAMATATRMAGVGAHWLVAAGPKNYEGLLESKQKLGIGGEFDVRAFLDADEMASALFRASVVVCRSGGSLAELAAFRKPSVLIPLPIAMGNHQFTNAKEFEAMGAAMILEQSELATSTLEARIRHWLADPNAYQAAQEALADWDIPDAADRILALIEEAAP